jgi:hypothetical protein
MSTSAKVALSVCQSRFPATNSLPELLACLFDVLRARDELELLEGAITAELDRRAASEGGGEESNLSPACSHSSKSSS